ELGGKIGVAVIDGCIEAELIFHIRALLGTARDADRPRPGDLRELANQRANRSARRRDNYRFSGLGLADHAQAGIRGESGHPEDAASPVVTGATAGSSLRRSARSDSACVRQPVRASTMSPSL